MPRPLHQRPPRNGSSDSTVEIVIALITIGASVLTAMAFAPRTKLRDDDRRDSRELRDDDEQRTP
ncbi:MAG: hypothetical protein OZ921_08725 [Sorangiineae bacterium]|nr:hypothetical protein [Polyangiaceae bacterium]MEB2322584.1 hypothetical protein [Sorangiineae bacterium]